MKGEALNNCLADNPLEEKAETLEIETKSNVNAKPLVDTLPDNLRQAKAKINFNTVAKTLQELKAKTLLVTLNYLKAEILKDTLVDTLEKD